MKIFIQLHNVITVGFLLPLLWITIPVQAIEKVKVVTKTPITMTLNKQQTISVQMSSELDVKSISVVTKKNKIVRALNAVLFCKSSKSKTAKKNCSVKLKITRPVPLGSYTLNLVGAKKQLLATGVFKIDADPTLQRAVNSKNISLKKVNVRTINLNKTSNKKPKAKKVQ